MARLTTPVREQPPGDERCIAYAVAAAIETSICRQRQTVAGVPEISVDDVFREGGSQVGSIAGIIKAARRGVVDAVCCPPGSPRCPDAASHLWRATLRLIGGNRKKRVELMRRELRESGPIVALIEIFSNFTSFTGTGVYTPVKPSAGFHAVCLIGDEVDASGSGGAWLAKNSMGENWGDAGFFRMAWGDRLVQPESVVYVVEDVRQ